MSPKHDLVCFLFFCLQEPQPDFFWFALVTETHKCLTYVFYNADPEILEIVLAI